MNSGFAIAADEARPDAGPGGHLFRLLERAIQRQTQDCALRYQRDTSRLLYLRNGSILQSNATSVSGCAARFVGGRLSGFAASSCSDEAGISSALRQARDNIECLRRRWLHADGPSLPAAAGSGLYDFRTSQPHYTAQDRIEQLRALNALMQETCPGNPTAVCGLEEVVVERSLVTSGGTRLYCYTPRTTLVVKLDLARDGSSGYAAETLTLFGEVEDRLEALVAQAGAGLEALYEHARHNLEAIYPEAGVHDVVLTPGLTGLLAHEAVGHPCEADHVIMGSAVADALGRQVAAETITVVDQAGCGFDGRATTASFVDDEGVPGRDVTIIENGMLVGFLHNRFTAGAMGAAPSGNARAGSFAGEPLIRMRNTAILPGGDKFGDMIAAIDRGYLLDLPGQGQADLSGQFTFGVTRGYEIRHGRIGRAIKNMTVSGNGFDVLKSVTHVGSDFAWMPSGWCNKGQNLPVTMGGPSLKARLTIGGR